MNRLTLGLVGLLLPSIAAAQTGTDLDAQGDAAKAQKNFPAAQTAYTQALATNPQDLRAYISRGSVRAKLGDNSGAIADDTAALALDPRNVVAFTNRGNARAAAHDFPGAIADYNHALTLDPKHAAAYLNRGNVENEQKNYPAALADYNQALALHPNDLLALYNRAGARRATGDYPGALADYSQVLAAQPADVRARINRAVLRMAQRDWTGASADLQKCLAQLPPDRQIYPRLYLWVVGVKQGNAARATQDLQQHLARTSAAYAATWPGQLERLCAGQMREPQLMLSAKDQPKKGTSCFAQACYFAAIRRMADHNPDGPAKLFQKSMKEGDPKMHETILAREELKQMGAHTP